MVDYKKRAERRREYYEKIVSAFLTGATLPVNDTSPSLLLTQNPWECVIDWSEWSGSPLFLKCGVLPKSKWHQDVGHLSFWMFPESDSDQYW